MTLPDNKSPVGWMIAAIVLALFCWLASYAYSHREASYSDKDRQAMRNLVGRSLAAATPISFENKRKLEELYGN